MCGRPVRRVMQPVAVHFKGSGFYNTDYGTRKRQREKAAAESSSKSNAAGSSDGASSSTSSDNGSSSAGKDAPKADKPAGKAKPTPAKGSK